MSAVASATALKVPLGLNRYGHVTQIPSDGRESIGLFIPDDRVRLKKLHQAFVDKSSSLGGRFMEWAIGAGSFIAGLVSGFTLKFVIDIRSARNVSKSTADAKGGSIAQAGNVAGGHIAGGNVNTGPK